MSCLICMRLKSYWPEIVINPGKFSRHDCYTTRYVQVGNVSCYSRICTVYVNQSQLISLTLKRIANFIIKKRSPVITGNGGQ